MLPPFDPVCERNMLWNEALIELLRQIVPNEIIVLTNQKYQHWHIDTRSYREEKIIAVKLLNAMLDMYVDCGNVSRKYLTDEEKKMCSPRLA